MTDSLLMPSQELKISWKPIPYLNLILRLAFSYAIHPPLHLYV